MTDPYVDPRSGTLRNRLHITDPDELAAVEAEVTGMRLVELAEHPLAGDYDLAHLREFHRATFADLYDWAGELRTVSIAKADVFCLPQHLESFAAEVFDGLRARTRLRGLGRAEFVTGLSDVFADLNALHPFREGNGRTQRAFLAQLARDAGHPIRWETMDPRTNVNSCRAAHRGDVEPLRAMLDALVERRPVTTEVDVPVPRAPGRRRRPPEAPV